jgi:predicted nucleic acid-binding protein
VASGSSVYDALYLALAAAWNCHLVTADKRLIARFSRVDGFGEIAQWIGDL